MTDNNLDNVNPPIAKQEALIREFHGRSFVDEYEWMRNKESQDTLDHLNAENTYTEAKTAHLKQLTENVFEEIKSRVKQTDMSVPSRSGDYWYYGRSEEGKEYGFSCRIPVSEGQDPWEPPVIPEEGKPEGEQILLDNNALAEGHDYFALGAASVTKSGRFLAYSTDTEGDERFELFIKDLETGKLLDDHLTDIFYGATWAGEDYIFYQKVDDAWRPDTVWRHKVGTAQSDDVCVFTEPDERFRVGVGSTRSEKDLIIAVGSPLTSEYWVLDMDNPEGEFEVLWERETGVEYDIDHVVRGGKDQWLVTHNAHGPNFEVSWVDANANPLPGIRDLDILVPHNDDVRIEGVDTYRDFATLSYRRGGIPRVAVMQLVDDHFGDFEEIDFDEEIYSAGSAGNPEWDAPVIRLSYTSYTQPAQLFQYRIATGERTLLKEQEVPGGYNADEYEAYREWAIAKDGTQIPVSIVKRKDLATDSPRPALLYGYGSYEASMDPGFSVSRLSLLDRGMLYVVAHVRGGGEMGRLWYDEGKLMAKKNTFTDFIDVADHLINNQLTSPEVLVAEGGSAGGLLVGAVANMAPDRFKGIQAVVPFVDPLTSILKPELPLTVGEWEEWGDPYHDPEVYDYMATYAPYENVAAQDYPDILAVTSLNDTRVLYVEPAKWIAKLRQVATGGEFLLKTEMTAGHGGVSGRYARWHQTAFEYAWTINKATGLVE
ncbi:S9 family peptidase [Corynebacterium stationis]|uniref:S9 family peptidase n=1 Tax=Corynebacterium stationis TaxID=1705 RepID=UPI00076F86B9|nr:S9 family peptidase [Corynebacterium stationis]AMJ45374.1 protease 2 [Corynebacterium stationis]AQX71828.1 oligopeptidase B [Corynebacterium stationis]ASJ19510.1 oligopeptidase B [Corynebacterium stationis]